MGSLLRSGKSVNFQASFKVWDGKQWKWVRRSTGTDDEQKALAVLEGFEQAALLAGPRAKGLDRAAAFEIIRDIVSAVGNLSAPWVSYSAQWHQVRSKRVKPASARSYQSHINNFSKWLGEDKGIDLELIDLQRAQDYYDDMVDGGLSAKSAKGNIKTLSMIWDRALAENYVSRNPWSDVERRYGQSNEREPFTMEDVSKLLITCDNGKRDAEHARDWRTMIILGLCTGARAGDCRAMEWANVQESNGIPVIAFSPEKKQRKHSTKAKLITIPVIPLLSERLNELREGAMSTEGPLCPSLYEIPIGGRWGISDQFRHLVDQSGIEFTTVPRNERGIEFRSKSFHSFRHTLNSLLFNAGVPVEWRSKILDHESKAVNQGYSHADVETLEEFLSSVEISV